jgi:hypothetical protein
MNSLDYTSMINTVWQPAIPQTYAQEPSIPEMIFNQFCLCELGFACKPKPVEAPMVIKGSSKRTIQTYDFSSNIDRLIQQLNPICTSPMPFTRTAKKSQACSAKVISKRRSRFTGVTKNSSNYQTLIVVKGRKIYVGSYPQEEYAAITFDFYSIILHGSKATTNFAYTPQDILRMIDTYTSSGKAFSPEGYVKNIKTINQ